MKTIQDLLNPQYPCQKQLGSMDIEIKSLCLDSRKATGSSLFFAIKGELSDGHQFIANAIALGAKAIVCEKLPENIDANISYLEFKDSHRAMARMAAAFYDHPSAALNLVGITGTNGKTTIATLLYRLFEGLGYKTGLISTVENRIHDRVFPSERTTPDAIELNSLLAQIRDEGCQYCFMEVSSHAVVQKRIEGLDFKGGVFSNLSHDHLDYHKTFAAYLEAKKAFFDSLDPSSFALSNKDDRNGVLMLQNTKANKYYYSLQNMADFKCRLIENSFLGLQLELNQTELWCKLMGRFNAYNLCAIYGTALLLGQDNDEVLRLLSSLESADGRFEVLSGKFTVIIDYAHTPDALENVLQTIKDIRQEGQKIICLVGCGGNRDALKRPIMGAVGGKYADLLILSSDNPRDENPQVILDQMYSGLDALQAKKCLKILDREEAIKMSCLMAKEGDIILIAGKGHETYQEISSIKYPFDDRMMAKKYINP